MKPALVKLLILLVSAAGGVWLAFDFARSVHGYVAVYTVVGMWLIAAGLLLLGLILLVPKRTRGLGFTCLGGVAIFVGTFFASVNLLDFTDQVGWKHQQMERFGPDVEADLVVYFRKGTTTTEIKDFSERVLTEPHPGGTGRAFRYGIRSYLRLLPLDGHEGIALTFFRSASADARGQAKLAIRSWPTVFRVFENVAPADVRTLEPEP